jgi:hypothetical protein
MADTHPTMMQDNDMYEHAQETCETVQRHPVSPRAELKPTTCEMAAQGDVPKRCLHPGNDVDATIARHEDSIGVSAEIPCNELGSGVLRRRFQEGL